MGRNFKHQDFVHTGPDTLAGQYLRRFWQPLYCSHDLPTGRAVPARILGEDYTLYRGKSGTPYVVGFRCAHRGTQMSAGWVEDDCIRCFYHGWKYDGLGQCIEQPAEPTPFASKIRIPGYPVKEYLGLIFVYLGKGEPAPFTFYPKLESPDFTVDAVRYDRICNFYNNIDNSLDNAHVRFVHQRHRETRGDFYVQGDPQITAEETDWGVKRKVKYPNGAEVVAYFGMPNINYVNGQVVDPEVKRADVLLFKVPVDDDSHIHFELRAIPLKGDYGQEWLRKRREKRSKEAEDRAELVESVLKGKLRLEDIDPNRTDYVIIEDEIAQAGQGRIPDRGMEHLGRSDSGVILLRQLWERELKALADGQRSKEWTYRPDMVPAFPTR
ncbi:MAG: Rieske 2Fe-2S domain-containing protein [Candidatus Binatia bacterium]